MVAAGCTTLQTYPGPQLPPEKVAKLEGTIHYYIIALVVSQIAFVDGKFVPWDKAEMLPAKHEVVVYLEATSPKAGNTGKFQTFSFVAEAGHVYKVDGNWNFGNNEIWITDRTTGQIVAGKKP